MVYFLTFLSLALIGAGPVSAHFEILHPMIGMGILGFGIFMLALLFFPSLVGLFKYGAKKANWLTLFCGLAALGAIGALGYFSYLHPINDITTDLQNPPKFLKPVFRYKVEKGGEFLDASQQVNRDYHKPMAAVQVAVYPELASGIVAQGPSHEAYTMGVSAVGAELRDWKLVLNDEKTQHAEFEVESKVFRFVDDVVIEARQNPENPFQSRLELRSRSRFGRSDLGVNAARLRDLKIRLQLAVEPLEQIYKIKRQEWEKSRLPPSSATAPKQPTSPGVPAVAAAPAAAVSPAPANPIPAANKMPGTNGGQPPPPRQMEKKQ